MNNALVVVPWHNPKQLGDFLSAWQTDSVDPLLVLQQDKNKDGCARTKNKGIQEAIRRGAEVIVILDDDCFPNVGEAMYSPPPKPSLQKLADDHLYALGPQRIEMFTAVTEPPSRGTPYFERAMEMPVAASMGFWTGIGDYDATGQLAYGAQHPMIFKQSPIFGRYFPLCGMNLAFRKEWWPWCQFIDVARFDDIWQGFIWQKEAYRRGYCFNLSGPLVQHSRQSNVFANLRDEAIHLERNETLWRDIAQSRETEYSELVKLLPPL